METEYRSKLVVALRKCAAGVWGLFGQNERLGDWEKSEDLLELPETASAINALRKRLGDQPFPLHMEFEAARGKGACNDFGEPKLAELWLEKLGED
ncbi:hypothetical protein [Novosphingobium ginsenosidimutans]|uniref:hypothetical protein n=1 Tax=Novosphingobium ginsenosidimutans TaxID=1176536 RepID=UPI001EE2F569|nr:hypothetical protein [Novosphingobium ginsenosidimutans]